MYHFSITDAIREIIKGGSIETSVLVAVAREKMDLIDINNWHTEPIAYLPPELRHTY
jgi:hypothetical protein